MKHKKLKEHERARARDEERAREWRRARSLLDGYLEALAELYMAAPEHSVFEEAIEREMQRIAGLIDEPDLDRLCQRVCDRRSTREDVVPYAFEIAWAVELLGEEKARDAKTPP